MTRRDPTSKCFPASTGQVDDGGMGPLPATHRRPQLGQAPASWSRWLRWSLAGLGAGWVLLLVLLLVGGEHGVTTSTGAHFHDLGLTTAIPFAAGVLILVRSAAGARREPAWTVLGIGLVLLALGDATFAVHADVPVAGRTASLADVFLAGFYVCAYATVALLIRSQLRDAPRSVWLDGLVAALALGAIVAAALDEPVGRASGSLVVTAALAYPVADAILLVLVAFGMVLVGPTGRPALRTMTASFLVLTAADVLYWAQTARGEYVHGTWIDSLWSAAAIGLAVAAWRPAHDGTRRRASPVLLLLAPVISLLVATGVLAVSAVELPGPAVALAAASVVGVAVRLAVTVTETSRLADVRRLAATDELTALPNRIGFTAAADQAMKDADAPHCSLLVVDLNGFKEVNDSLGHAAGDRLLAAVARVLEEVLRSPRDLLGRLGGDEFALLLPLTDRTGAHEVARRIHEALAMPVMVDGVRVQVSASIGVAEAPQDGTDLPSLLRRADIAMNRAKGSRLGQAHYDARFDGEGENRLQRIGELRAAIDSGQLVLHYQPKIALGTGTVVAVEALVRWDRPGSGLVFPDDFLPVAEYAGLMPSLTAAVLEEAVARTARCRADGVHLPVAVNLPTSAVVDADLPAQIRGLLARHGVPPGLLEVEITEEALLQDRMRARTVLAALRADGVRVSIDDYGSGYSSLAYLRELTVDEVKLDKAFVLPMAQDARATAIVHSTIHLAHALGLQIVAEGVEDEGVAATLEEYGCDTAQGYFWTRALPADELLAWLALPGTPSTEPAGR